MLVEATEVPAVSVGRDVDVEATGVEEADAKESLPGGVGEGEGGGEGGGGGFEEEAMLTLILAVTVSPPPLLLSLSLRSLSEAK